MWWKCIIFVYFYYKINWFKKCIDYTISIEIHFYLLISNKIFCLWSGHSPCFMESPHYLPSWAWRGLSPHYLPLWVRRGLSPDYLPSWVRREMSPHFLPSWVRRGRCVLTTCPRWYEEDRVAERSGCSTSTSLRNWFDKHMWFLVHEYYGSILGIIQRNNTRIFQTSKTMFYCVNYYIIKWKKSCS